MSSFDITQLIAGSAFGPGTAAANFNNAANPVVSDGAVQGGAAARTGAGVYTYPIRASATAGGANDGLSSNEHHALGTTRSTNGSGVMVAWTSQVLITATTSVNNAGFVATDVDHDFVIFKTRRVA